MDKKEINSKPKQELISVISESNELPNFLNFLQAMFPKENIAIDGSLDKQKAELAFRLLQKKKCTTKEFRETLDTFAENHSKYFWMPADIIEAFHNATATSRFRI